MRIIDKRKDYYDNVIQGSDYPVWIRKEKVYQFDDALIFTKDEREFIKEMMDFAPRVYTPSIDFNFVGLCGKIYCVFTATNKDNKTLTTPSASEVRNFIKMKDKKYSTMLFRFGFGRKFDDDWVDDWKREFSNKRLYDLFIKLGTPIIKFDRKLRSSEIKVVINPLLYPIGFQTVIDPWTIYQEIDMFLGNDLVKDKLGNFQMTDELKRDSKGFDDWSFKNRGKK